MFTDRISFDEYKLNCSEEFIENNFPKCIPTGLDSLDDLIGGGLPPYLILLGGAPSLGKSSLALQMAQNISKSGTPVFYFSLEMSMHSVAMKSINRTAFQTDLEKRLAAKRDEHPLNPGDLCGLSSDIFPLCFGDKESAEYKVAAAARERSAKESGMLYLIEMDDGKLSGDPGVSRAITVDYIAGLVENYYRLTGNKPVVFLDYLQILSSDPELDSLDERTLVDNNIRALWKLAHSFEIPVVVLSSINRASYNVPISIASLKESGGIEFTADLILGLQLSAFSKQSFVDVREEMKKEIRGVELIVLKHRFGRTEVSAEYQFVTSSGFFFNARDYSVSFSEKAGKKKKKASMTDEEEMLV